MPKEFVVFKCSEAEFTRLFDPKCMLAAEKQIFERYDALLEANASRPSGEMDALTAAAYLTEARTIIERDLCQAAERFSSLQWLMYLRNLPSFYWKGELPTTALFDTSLAEVVSARSSAHAKFRASKTFPYPLNTFVARKVSEYAAGIRYLSQLYVNLRLAGKGASFAADRPTLRAVMSSELCEAVERYDARVAADMGVFLARSGSFVASNVGAHSDTSLAALFRTPTVPGRGSWEETLAAQRKRERHEWQFFVELFDLADLAALNARLGASGLRWWTETAAVLAGFLRAMSGPMNSVLSSTIVILQSGCYWTSWQGVEETPPEVFEDCRAFAQRIFPGTSFPPDMRALYAAVAQIPGRSWPLLHGPAIRCEDDVVCVDLHAATHTLQDAATFWTTGGPEAVLKGHDFERAVQAYIDESPWSPPSRIRKHIGAKLREHGQFVSDLDALAYRDGHLVVVSCKSLIYSEAYSEGVFQAIRAVEGTVVKAVEKLREVTEFLQRNPLCLDGIDFSSCEVIAVVCVPLPPFVKLGAATEYAAPGLLRAVSLRELVTWFNTS